MRATGHVRHPWLRRFSWLVLIWAAGVLALGIVAMAFRWLMDLAGLTTG